MWHLFDILTVWVSLKLIGGWYMYIKVDDEAVVIMTNFILRAYWWMVFFGWDEVVLLGWGYPKVWGREWWWSWSFECGSSDTFRGLVGDWLESILSLLLSVHYRRIRILSLRYLYLFLWDLWRCLEDDLMWIDHTLPLWSFYSDTWYTNLLSRCIPCMNDFGFNSIFHQSFVYSLQVFGCWYLLTFNWGYRFS